MRVLIILFLLVTNNLLAQKDLRVDFKKDKSFFWREDGYLKYKGKLFSGQIFETFRNNNTKYIETYFNGKLEGKHEGFYKNGTKKFSHSHSNGLENGYFEYFHKNGNLSQKGTTVNGKTKEIETFRRNGLKKNNP